MDWKRWRDGQGALANWKEAAEGLAKQVFGSEVRKEEAKDEKPTFWVLVKEPLDGVRLLRLP